MDYENDSHHYPDYDPEPPGAIRWLFQQVGWYSRKLVLWPIADSFRWGGRVVAGFFDLFRYRSPFAYIGATLALCLTGGAVAAAVYFEQQSRDTTPAPEPAAVAGPAPAPAPAVAPAPAPTTPAQDPDTLAGVVPTFDDTATGSSGKKRRRANTVVKPAPAPGSGPLRVAHRFATAFAGYEIGERKATRRIRLTASPKLARELRRNPPKLPSGGNVPKAAVMNVVKGKRSGDRMIVSVALKRAGGASELRLGMTRNQGRWRVSEVKG